MLSTMCFRAGVEHDKTNGVLTWVGVSASGAGAVLLWIPAAWERDVVLAPLTVAVTRMCESPSEIGSDLGCEGAAGLQATSPASKAGS